MDIHCLHALKPGEDGAFTPECLFSSPNVPFVAAGLKQEESFPTELQALQPFQSAAVPHMSQTVLIAAHSDLLQLSADT